MDDYRKKIWEGMDWDKEERITQWGGGDSCSKHQGLLFLRS